MIFDDVVVGHFKSKDSIYHLFTYVDSPIDICTRFISSGFYRNVGAFAWSNAFQWQKQQRFLTNHHLFLEYSAGLFICLFYFVLIKLCIQNKLVVSLLSSNVSKISHRHFYFDEYLCTKFLGVFIAFPKLCELTVFIVLLLMLFSFYNQNRPCIVVSKSTAERNCW